MARLIATFAVLVIAGCTTPPTEPEDLLTYSANPFCLLFCDTSIADDGGQFSVNKQIGRES